MTGSGMLSIFFHERRAPGARYNPRGVEIDSDYLRRHYAAMSDEALLSIDPSELVESARTCYQAELARRRSAPHLPGPEKTRAVSGVFRDWLDDAACVGIF